MQDFVLHYKIKNRNKFSDFSFHKKYFSLIYIFINITLSLLFIFLIKPSHITIYML
ncbi:hypothetical protein HMPREF9554_01334 [Treponema phagedenis F0421]|nr:hypothetical protein HMPREF9554_01334 [Treponema phagedenis F0421]